MAIGGTSFGGAAGATVGGIKLVRVYRIGQGLRSKVQRLFLSEAEIGDLDVGDRTAPFEAVDAEVRNAALFVILSFALLGVGPLVLLVVVRPGYTFAEVLFEAASAQGRSVSTPG